MSVIDDAIKVLNDNAHLLEAQTLGRLGKDLESKDSVIRTVAVEKLRGLCQVRAYGDLNIKTMNGWQWNSLLERVVICSEEFLTSKRDLTSKRGQVQTSKRGQAGDLQSQELSI